MQPNSLQYMMQQQSLTTDEQSSAITAVDQLSSSERDNNNEWPSASYTSAADADSATAVDDTSRYIISLKCLKDFSCK